MGTEEALYSGPIDEALVARDVSSDGRYAIFDNFKLNGLTFDIVAMTLSGDRKPIMYLHSRMSAAWTTKRFGAGPM